MNFDPRVSVRARLALWNVLTLIAILTVFCIALRIGVEHTLIRTLDHQLAAQLDPIVHFLQRPPRNGFPGMGGPPPDGFGGGEPGPMGRPEERPIGPFGLGEGGRFGGGPFGGRRPGGPPRYKAPPGMFQPRIYPQDASLPPYSPEALERIAPGGERFSNTLYDGQPVRVYTVPIVREGRIVAKCQMAASLTEIQNAMTGLTTATLSLIPVLLLLAGGGALALTSSALKPVRDLTGAASRIGGANLSERLPVRGEDEFAQLAGILNEMLSRIETAFARQKRFTADASHELRTPLAVIKANSSYLLEDDTATLEELRNGLQTIDSASDRAQRIVQDLLLLARGENGSLPVQWSPVSLKEVLTTAVKSVRTGKTQPIAPIEIIAPSDTCLVSDRDHLTRLFINLLENAVRHTAAEGRITIGVQHANQQLTVAVADTGEGIPAEHLSRIIEPFYRVDAARSRKSGGAGLGLAICRSIVDAFGGTLSIESVVGKGTTVIVTLPIAPQTATLPV
jgi:signal transduction histidine kinase